MKLINMKDKKCIDCEHREVINEEEPCASCYDMSNWEPRLVDKLLAKLVSEGSETKN